MPLTTYQKISYRWFGRIARLINTSKLSQSLKLANLGVTEEIYLSSAIFTMLIVFLSVILIAIILFIIAFLLNFLIPMRIVIFLFIIAPISAGLVYVYYLLKPTFVAKNRARKIDMHLPYALNFIAAMSAAGVTPAQVFESLSKQEIYGEMKNEAMLIYRDMSLLGKDILSAMRSAIDRSPSKKFSDFLQGAVVTVTSGGSLKTYFTTKAEQFMRENKQIQRKLNETLATMAECYVTTAVAAPLMILIIIPLMSLMSPGGSSQIFLMYIFIFLILPLIHMGFVILIKSLTPEV